MSWRSSLENKHTVTCFICNTDWIYPSRKSNQKYGLCAKCAEVRQTTIFVNMRSTIKQFTAGISKTAYKKHADQAGIIMKEKQ